MIEEKKYTLESPADSVSVKDLPALKGDGGQFIFKIAYTSLKEGKTDKELANGAYGRVVFINLTGEISNLTRETIGKVTVPVFINTKSHYLANNIFALCGLYNKATQTSEFVPVKKENDDGTVSWSVPALHGKEFVVGLAKSGVYYPNDGDPVDQYEITGVLATNGASAYHAVEGVCDTNTINKDYANFSSHLKKRINELVAKRQAEVEQAKQQFGAGASNLGTSEAPRGIIEQAMVDNGIDLPDLPF